MADEPDKDSKTEQPTEKKLRDAIAKEKDELEHVNTAKQRLSHEREVVSAQAEELGRAGQPHAPGHRASTSRASRR